MEDEGVPSDARVVDTTWRFVNKSVGPIGPYNNNRQIPIALYRIVQFSSSTGRMERFQFFIAFFSCRLHIFEYS